MNVEECQHKSVVEIDFCILSMPIFNIFHVLVLEVFEKQHVPNIVFGEDRVTRLAETRDCI